MRPLIVFLRGGGDLASGVAMRLFRAGLKVIITELPEPLVVRRLVSFANAVYEGRTAVEDIQARRASDLQEAFKILEQGRVPVLVDPHNDNLKRYREQSPEGAATVLVDGRMTKKYTGYHREEASLVIGLGPGFIAGENCHVAVETNRGHFLGRLIWQGAPQADTGVPGSISKHGADRVMRAPADGFLTAHAAIGDLVKAGQQVAEVAGQAVSAPFDGVLRGLIYPGLEVRQGLKIGDVDPRGEPLFCSLVSEKSLAIGGSVLEAILSQATLRPHLWERNEIS